MQGNYAAYGGNSLPTFRNNLSIPSSRIKNPRSGSLKSHKTELYSKTTREVKDFPMLLLLRRPLRDAVRSEHSRKFGNQRQSKRDAGNNDQNAKDRSSYKCNLTRNLKTKKLLIINATYMRVNS